MCQTASAPARKRRKRASEESAEPRLQRISTVRRSLRSTIAPAKGATSIPALVKTIVKVNWVTEWLFSSTQIPMAKLVSPEPSSETSCPSQRVVKDFMP
jgi:hypothetical protein